MSSDSNFRVTRKDLGSDSSLSGEDTQTKRAVPTRDFSKVLSDREDAEKQAAVRKQAKVAKKPFSLDKEDTAELTAPEDEDIMLAARYSGKKAADDEEEQLAGQMEGQVAEQTAEEEVSKEKFFTPETLFTPEKSGPPEKPVASEPLESPFMLYNKRAAPKKINPQPLPWQSELGRDTDPVTSVGEGSLKKFEKEPNAKSQDAARNLSGVNIPQVGVPVASVGEAPNEVKGGSSLPSNLQIVVERLVKELYVVEQKGQTDTVVILQKPPMFKDAQIVVTSFNSATKEFNVAFENLTGPAKQLIDANLPNLRAYLESKGFANAVHIITTTTQVEHNVFTGSDERGRQEDTEQGRGRGGRQPKQDEEEA